MSFGSNLKYLRRVKNLSQRDLATASDMHIREIGFYESGERKPGLDSIVKLCRGLECSPSQLIKVRSKPDSNGIETLAYYND